MLNYILIIEDNPDSAETLRIFFQTLGYTAGTAYDGLSGLEQCLKLKPRVVLCDLGLPGMDGYAVAEAITAAKSGWDPLLVAVSGYGESEDIDRAKRAGFAFHLTKPLDLDVLAAKVEPYLKMKE